MNTLNERLAEAMSATGKSDRLNLAKAMGISVQAVGAVINGKSKSLNAENCSKAARYLGVSTDWLAAGYGKMLPDKDKVSPSAEDWPLLGLSKMEWELASDIAKGTINAYARMVLDQDLRRTQESHQESMKRAA